MVDGLGTVKYQEVLERFQAWMDESSGTKVARAWHLGRQKVDEIYSTLSWPGHLGEEVLHTRTEFDETLRHFVQTNDDIFGGPHSALIMAAFEFDFLTRP